MATISVSVIAFNEAPNLRSCLETVTWTDELIVVDCTSNDGTAQVAREFAAKVYTRPNNPNLNVNKSYGFSRASGDWIFYLDPDERATPQLAREILDVVRRGTPFDAFVVPRRNHYLGRWLRRGGKYPDLQLRLFRRGKAHFPCRHVHEKLVVEGRVGRLRGALVHYPYESMSDCLRKLDFYTSFEAARLLEAGRRPAWRSAVVWMVWQPAERFLRRYFLKLGFADGVPGLLACVFDSMTVIVSYAKFWELSRGEGHRSSARGLGV